MANKVTAHSKIKVIRSEITVQTKELKNCYQNIYIKMKCNTVYSPYVTASIEITYNCLKRLEKALCAAQQAATAIAGLTSKVPENTVSFSISPNRGSYPIDITVSDARACLDKMCNCKSAFDKISAGLDSCKSEISNLPVEDQTLNSVSVIETVFTGMYHGIFGGGSKVEIVKKAKQAFVNTMADAARIINELNAAITEFASKNGKLSKLLDEFETCEDKAFRQYEENFAKKYIDKTKQYTDSSLPDEAQLDNEITGLENAKNMLNSITCEECKDFDEEIIRLENLYENHYGFETKVNDFMNREGLKNPTTDNYCGYKDWVTNYKGYSIQANTCKAMAYIFQIEATGKTNHDAGFVSNNKADKKMTSHL